MKQKITIFLLLAAIAVNVKAQFTLDAQYRNRAEYRDGYQRLAPEGAIPSIFLSQRTRLTFGYETPFLKIKITPQDVRVWGDQQSMSNTGPGDNPSLDLFEGYAELKLGNAGWMSVGRQQLKYDNEVILGARNWGQAGMSYDAVVFKLKAGKCNVHVGSSWNSLAESNKNNLYLSSRIKSLSYLWINHKFNDKFMVSVLHVASGVTVTDTTNKIRFRQTSGLYTEYKSGGLSAWGDVYYQYGKTRADVDVSAMLAQAEAGYTLGKFTPGIGIGYLSGNSKIGAEAEADHVIDILYGGARNRYFGLIDYFRNYSTDTKQGGLTDLNFFISYKPSKTVTLRNAGHFFSLAETNASTPDSKYLGYENDLQVNYKFADWGMLEGGYFFILPTEALKKLHGVQDDKFSHYLYLMLTLTPSLFKQQPQ
jgi:hypothetical protein